MGREISDRSKQAFVGGRRRERRIYDKTSFNVRPLDKIQRHTQWEFRRSLRSKCASGYKNKKKEKKGNEGENILRLPMCSYVYGTRNFYFEILTRSGKKAVCSILQDTDPITFNPVFHFWFNITEYHRWFSSRKIQAYESKRSTRNSVFTLLPFNKF